MGDLAPGETVDQYQLLDVIARSGMATIFRARDLENGHPVALKVPHLQYASDLVFHERFRREEEIGQRLDHPAVIKVFRPRQKSRLYLAMEHVAGDLLRDRLRRERRLPVPAAVELAIQIADALVCLHDHGVIHRDLKPENIMVTPDGRVKLVDFGIALDTTLRKMTWAGLSQTVGTPDYMAPEQVKGKRGDARSDLYALGVILYEMLTGEMPFQGDNVYAAMRAKLHDDPTPPASRDLAGPRGDHPARARARPAGPSRERARAARGARPPRERGHHRSRGPPAPEANDATLAPDAARRRGRGRRLRPPRLGAVARRIGARPKTSWVATRTRGCSVGITPDCPAAAGEASAAERTRAVPEVSQRSGSSVGDGPVCAAVEPRAFVCRAGFASRGTAVARDARATCSRPCPRPKKSWVAPRRAGVSPGSGGSAPCRASGSRGRARARWRAGASPPRPTGPRRAPASSVAASGCRPRRPARAPGCGAAARRRARRARDRRRSAAGRPAPT